MQFPKFAGFNLFATLNCLALFTTLMLLPHAATASTENAGNAAKYVTIPVYYVTDRELAGETFGSHRRYRMQCQHHMYYGTTFVKILNSHHIQDGPLTKRLGWVLSDTKPAKFAEKNRIDPADPDASKKAFFERVENGLVQSGKSELCVFVHGAADAFEDCSQDAAEAEYSMERPLVLYFSPSDPKWRGYFIDSSNNEWSQGHFDQFWKDLIALHAQHPMKVISISHSMGNRLVIRSLPVVFGKELVSDWEIISPDMDADTCRHYIMGFPEGKSNIRLFVSNRDKMLPLAQMLAGGYYRVGEAANPASLPPNWKAASSQSMQRIDFTAVDHGFTGHTIPFDLVAHIVNDGTPGPGLELVSETEVRGNRLIKAIDKRHHVDSITEGLPPEFCKRVVRTK